MLATALPASDDWQLHPSDVAFSAVYGLITGLITGKVWHGVLNQPVAGASVAAIDKTADRHGPRAIPVRSSVALLVE